MLRFTKVESFPRITCSNSKLGNAICDLSLTPITTCRTDAPCFKTCYARKICALRKTCRNLYENNLMAYLAQPEQFFDNVIYQLKWMPFKFMRWHSSGDIVDLDYLKGMVRVAKECPNTKFLAFTKKYELVNEYLDTTSLPQNLKIVFSGWGAFKMPNPHNLPTAYIKFKKENEFDTNSVIPSCAKECHGGDKRIFGNRKFTCMDCVNSNMDCWSLHNGESVYFNQH